MIVQREVHQAAAREQDAESATGGVSEGAGHCTAGPAGGIPQDAQRNGHREQVNAAAFVKGSNRSL